MDETIISNEQKQRADAVRFMLQHSNDPEDKIDLEYMDKFEKRANMTLTEKLKDMSSNPVKNVDDRLKQRFDCIRGIFSVRGAIYIDVDEHKALLQAKHKAFRVLGPNVDEETYKNYVAENMPKSTILSIRKLLRNIKTLSTMVATNPTAFGDGHGGGEIRDIMEACLGAIKDARAYLKRKRYDMPEGTYELLYGGDLQSTDKKSFAQYIGEDWDKHLDNKLHTDAAERLIIKG